uniref:RING-H2 finger protein ATL60-like n=1 Tax=Elaeis guineensis var. tenera TaxID=51953 RepID=A0A6I9RT94_ELAGV|nr:RING-H2 finger protein ATL60-like [Elaeis guineensis]
MTSGGCKSFRNVVNINFSSSIGFPVAKLLIIGGFIAITTGFILLIACWMVCLFCRMDKPIDIATIDATTAALISTAATTTIRFSSSATFSCHGGINPKVSGSLEVFVCSSSSLKEKIECAVYLMVIKNGDRGRLLSRCGHGFY